MGTRSGDIDPAVVLPPAPGGRPAARRDRRRCSTPRSGLRGPDRRQRHARGASAGAPPATPAADAGASTSTAAGSRSTSARTWPCSAGVDAITFTAGVGENAAAVRAAALAGLERSASRSTRAATPARRAGHLARRRARSTVLRGADRRGAGDRRGDGGGAGAPAAPGRHDAAGAGAGTAEGAQLRRNQPRPMGPAPARPPHPAARGSRESAATGSGVAAKVRNAWVSALGSVRWSTMPTTLAQRSRTVTRPRRYGMAAH